MDNLQEKYNELDEIESTLRILIDGITNEDYIYQLQEIMYQAQNEKDEIEPELQEIYAREDNEMNYQYERSVI